MDHSNVSRFFGGLPTRGTIRLPLRVLRSALIPAVLVLLIHGVWLPTPGLAEQPAANPILHAAPRLCLAMDTHGVLYIADGDTGSVRCLTRDGESATFVSGVPHLCAIAVSHHRSLAIGTTEGAVWLVTQDGRITMVHPSGAPIASLTFDRDGAILAATASGTILRLPTP